MVNSEGFHLPLVEKWSIEAVKGRRDCKIVYIFQYLKLY